MSMTTNLHTGRKNERPLVIDINTEPAFRDEGRAGYVCVKIAQTGEGEVNLFIEPRNYDALIAGFEDVAARLRAVIAGRNERLNRRAWADIADACDRIGMEVN